MSDGSLRVPITNRFLKACHNPKIAAEARRIGELSDKTGIAEHVLEGGTPATQKDIDDLNFTAQFDFLEVSG